ncbi:MULTISPECIES: C40 family peptidase [Chryseobacterium]|uniref:Lipoprotein NlpC n=1 Tax=Chryseobacterium camelliae TaxID=1265445 RepID=A0ABU0TGJ5_9FLAO|nr:MULTISPECIES: C40 family peptidase [Chryseobacterium]MDT3406026.1 putative lipoprotein NlpC [Pseudacidovorax intermedius]MDQ1096173.1 putative lipoprotein NlpC [Chryseobacterium camelliae]MDQ1100109.1 putative lipoprotein NlpC [Chryseobacterium sp. SORGH_AS_1048]MDR6087453.1 putative lipoprotein NlpC [Chryseobacterium sp. SORGH_AS_0909]MDR6131827.1 putative lipoprotein NlpC [Chryseobacterium sp. SORGH_AS_1175]
MEFRWSKKKLTIQHMSVLMIASVLAVSCGSSKNMPVKRKKYTVTVSKSEELRTLNSDFSGKIPQSVAELLRDAEKYLGAPYKFGGDTSSGFDCSGLALKVFEENDYKLPRRSADQSETGKKIDIRDVKPGDLLFFATAGGNRVSHVGIVHDIGKDGEVKFIHSSTSKGVIISSLNEKYWNKAYLHAQRVL